jgi:hypothetical protein
MTPKPGTDGTRFAIWTLRRRSSKDATAVDAHVRTALAPTRAQRWRTLGSINETQRVCGCWGD